MSDMTELQRDILTTARNNPDATRKQISEMCDCSASYVSEVLNDYDSVNAFNSDLGAMPEIEPIDPVTYTETPVWLEDAEPMVDEEFDESVEEGLAILGQWLKRGYKGLKTLIRKVSN